MNKVLLIEDEENFGMVLKSYLELSEFRVTWCKNGNEGLRAYRESRFDVCVLDIMMPERDGFSVASEIRKGDSELPIVFLTAKSLKEDIVRGYAVGGDDFLQKPFDSEVLILKLQTLIARSKPQKKMESKFQIGHFEFNSSNRELSGGDQVHRLSPKECALLQLLCEHMNEVLPRELALNRIWKNDGYFTTRSMDVYIAKLRKLLMSDPSVEIVNIHGSGFRLMAIT